MQTVKTLIRLFLNVDSEDSDQTGHFVGFCHEAAQTLNGNKILTKIMDNQGP